MSIDLEPCPFCGKVAVTINQHIYGEVVGCGAAYCAGNHIRVSADLWNTRKNAEQPDELSSDKVRIGVGCAMENYECSHKEWNWNDMAKEAIREIQRLCTPMRESVEQGEK